MAYIGHSASGNFTTKPSKDTFSGDGSTTAFTLSEGATTNTVDVFVENVRQEPTTAYTVDGTTLTFTAAPGSGTNNIYVVNRGPLQLSATHPAAQALEASTGTFTGALSGVAATFTGDLTVDTNTLVVDSTNNRVGIGTTTVDSNAVLGINGRATFGDQATSGTVGAASLLIGANALYIQAGENTSSTNAADIRFTNIGGSAERMRIDSTGNVGIGTSSPACGLHVDNPDNAAITAIFDTDNSAVKMVFRNNTETGNNVQIGADGSNLVGLTGGTERIRIQSGGGISFNGDTATANALDDYEEGTWTPVFQGTGSNPTVSYNIQVGRYVKVGTVITVSCRLQTASTSGGSGSLLIGGLPFAAQNVNYLYYSGAIGYSALYTTVAPQTAHLNANGTQASMICNSGADGRFSLQTAVTTGNLTNTNGANDTMMTMTYITA